MNKREIIIGGAAFAVGAAASGTCVYFLTKKRLRREAFTWANEEIENVKDTYKLLRKQPPYDKPETAAKAYLERMDELQFLAGAGVEAAEEAAEAEVEEALQDLEEAMENLQEVDEAAEAVDEILESNGYSGPATEAGRAAVRNIFDEAESFINAHGDDIRINEGFDELSARDPQPPFVIDTDAFHDDSNEFDKITITYFEEDDTLCDDREQLIPDKEALVGSGNLDKFGQDSDSKDTVFIRNERLKTDFEVVREDGSYASIVLGFKEMNESKRVKRMRDNE